jgi:glutaredoxin
MAAAAQEVRVYWQPGCTSCLRTKEFLAKHGVPFVSRNILADADAMNELARLGLRSVPYVVAGERYANGQALAEVARLLGIELGAVQRHPPAELARRIAAILSAAQRFLAQIPQDRLHDVLPGRPRSYLQLAYHLFNVADAFLEHERGMALVYDSYNRVPARDATRADVLAYGQSVAAAFEAWWGAHGASTDWAAKAAVYYGAVDRHEFLERTTWHAGQHCRQLQWVLSERLGIVPHEPIGDKLWIGLPMPENVWDPA